MCLLISTSKPINPEYGIRLVCYSREVGRGGEEPPVISYVVRCEDCIHLERDLNAVLGNDSTQDYQRETHTFPTSLGRRMRTKRHENTFKYDQSMLSHSQKCIIKGVVATRNKKRLGSGSKRVCVCVTTFIKVDLLIYA